MSGKTAIVTGSSSGFGLLSCIELAKSGFTVIATMRDVSKANVLLELAEEKGLAQSLHIHPLDVTSPESIHDFGKILEGFDHVEVLVNNAGFAVGGFSEELSIDDYRRQFETNVFGVIAVTNAVLPFIRENGRGRIINIGSISGKVGFPGLSAYTSSKHALEGYSESLRLELKPFGIDVSCVEPGSYQTNIWSSIDTIEMKNDSPYLSYMKGIMNELDGGKASFGNPAEVAQLVARIASQTGTPKLRYPVGKGVKMNILLKNLLPWKWLEAIILKRLMP